MHLLPVRMHVRVRVERLRAVRTSVQDFPAVRGYVLFEGQRPFEHLSAEIARKAGIRVGKPHVTPVGQDVGRILAARLAPIAGRVVTHYVFVQTYLQQPLVADRTLALVLRSFRAVIFQVLQEQAPLVETLGACVADELVRRGVTILYMLL